MAEASRMKKRMFALLEVLKRETDEEHPLSSQEICMRLEEKGIAAERKAVYRDIRVLNESGMEILSTKSPKVGFFLAKREFELAEVRLLMDAVMTAPFITKKKTTELLQKLGEQLSCYQAEEMLGQVCIDQRVKFSNEEIYYTIDAIHRAISEKKKIHFWYYHQMISGLRAKPNQGREFTISPYALLWSNDKYYVAGNYEKYDSVGNYRLDRMKKVTVTNEKARPFEEVSGYVGQFDAADYLRKSFNMFSGEPQYIELSCDVSLLETVLDKLDSDADFLGHGNGKFTVRSKVLASEGLEEWLMQYGDRIEVLSPQELREKMRKKAESLLWLYGSQA